MKISWTSSGAGTRALTLLVLAVLACLLPGSLPGATATPRDDAASAAVEEPTPGAPSSSVTVALTDIRPEVLTPGEDLVVSGTVTNSAPTEVTLPELRLRAQQSAPISRSLLDRWLDPSSLSATTLLHAERLEDPVAAGATVPFTLTVPAEAVPYPATYAAWGPRGIEVTVHDAAATTVTEPAATRSFLLWWPDLEVETMPLAVLAAAAPTAPERTAAQESGARLDAVAAERLDPLLTALDRPGVDIAVDPSLLVDVPAVVDLTIGEAPTDAATEEPAPPDRKSDLHSTIEELTAAPGRTVHALLWADADAAGLAHAGRTDLLDTVADARDEALDAAGIPAQTELAWPVAEQPDTQTLAALATAGATAVVLPSDVLAATSQLTYTPSARADVIAEGTPLRAVLTDERLSGLLTGRLLPVNPAADQAAVELDPLTSRQYLLAETAVIARERPADRRDLLLTVPRDFAGDAEALGDQLAALARAPWLERTGLTEVLTHPAPELERESLPATAVEGGEVAAGELTRLSDVLDHTAAFAGVLDEPEALVDPVRTSLLEVTSAAWRELPETREQLVTAAEEAAATRRGLVAARPSSTLNLINNEAHIPVAVTNAMSRAANVLVRLSPRDPRLVADEVVELEIPPEQSATAQVPVHAVGSGDVVVDVVLAAPDGTPIDEPTEIRVRVRADWETVGTAAVAGLLVLMLVVGLVRTVRRARRRKLEPTVEETTA